MHASVVAEYVAAGCNRVVSSLSWGENGIIAYGSHRSIILYDPEESRVVATIVGHTDIVNCVCWFGAADFGQPMHRPPSTVTALASGSADGTVRIWLFTPNLPDQPWSLAAQLSGHTAPVTSIALQHSHNDPGEVVLVSTGGDGSINVWHCAASNPEAITQDSWRLVQTITLPLQHLQHASALIAMPLDPGSLLLSLGGVDAAVRLYLRYPGGQFEPVCRLTGHQDWVRGLAFTHTGGGKVLLASASEDKYVRMWAITPEGHSQNASGARAFENGDANLGNLADSLTKYAPKPCFAAGANAGGTKYTAALEALLIGHEDWVHSVSWQPRRDGVDGGRSCLLSSSMDRTMMLWVPDAATGLWLSEEAVGDAGANHLGYFTSTFSPDGTSLLAHSFTGALHLWTRSPDHDSWLPRYAGGGHVGPVVDCSWGVNDTCLLSASIDQTVRLSARLPNGRWCEAARPQVHGHDFNAVCAVPWSQGRVRYASASEEKVIRVFQAPKVFSDTLDMLNGRAPKNTNTSGAHEATAFGAVLPALGLSQKALYAETDVDALLSANVSDIPEVEGLGCHTYASGSDFAPTCAPSAVGEPPLEEHLAQNTLWPELHKLYGHGNEVFCLAADPQGRVLASACRAQSAATAAVWLWDAETWAPLGQLEGHTLTVTQIAFSPDGRLLASGSRDRTVQVYIRPEVAGGMYQVAARFKAHTRIVWSLDWSPDSRLLVTASRDDSIKIWDFSSLQAVENGANLPSASTPIGTCKFSDSVRSVAFAPAALVPQGPAYVIAAGLEDGTLQIVAVTLGEDGLACFDVLWSTTQYNKHAAAVRRLRWRVAPEISQANVPDRDGMGQCVCHLASCGDDHTLRVQRVQLSS